MAWPYLWQVEPTKVKHLILRLSLARIPAVLNHEICKVAAAKSARLQGQKSVCYRLSDERDRAVRGVGAVRRELKHVRRYHNRPTHRASCAYCGQGGRGRASQGRDQRYAGFRGAAVGGRYLRRRAHDLRDPRGDEEAVRCRDRRRDRGRYSEECAGRPRPFLPGAEGGRIGSNRNRRCATNAKNFRPNTWPTSIRLAASCGVPPRRWRRRRRGRSISVRWFRAWCPRYATLVVTNRRCF